MNLVLPITNSWFSALCYIVHDVSFALSAFLRKPVRSVQPFRYNLSKNPKKSLHSHKCETSLKGFDFWICNFLACKIPGKWHLHP